MAAAKAPAIVIIARHGARLDAEDHDWADHSPTPYDTPLSYGGWTQTRALGARIASLVHARDALLEENDSHTTRRGSEPNTLESHSRKRHRKHKVVIHSSPFLRCIQSSIAIAAGISQFQGNVAVAEANAGQPPLRQTRLFQPPTRAATLDSQGFQSVYRSNTGDPQDLGPTDTNTTQRRSSSGVESAFERTLLRVDACLGEWLSPDYFEFITSPPPSNMMVAGAKAELLRPAEPIQGAKIVNPDGSTIVAYQEPEYRRRPSFTMEELAEALPEDKRDHASVEALAEHERHQRQEERRAFIAPRGYQPPTPTYALSPHDHIPKGFVAHARNACVNVDFQWDSMRPPQLWGDGGSYGEEWSSMHRRFRSGLRSMIEWYKEKSVDFDPQDDGSSSDQDDQADEDVDVILVIITHGAGCNALIGALTNQPVLMDIGMASLTMAVRKSTSTRSPPPPIRSPVSPVDQRQPSPDTLSFGRRRSSSVDIGLSMEYDMKLIASTDHLRAGADPLKIPHLQSPLSMPTIAEHGRGNATPSSSDGAATPVEFDRNKFRNSSLGSIRRSNTSRGSTRSFSQASAGPTSSPIGSGLWSNTSSPHLGPSNGQGTNGQPSPVLEEVEEKPNLLADGADRVNWDKARATANGESAISTSPVLGPTSRDSSADGRATPKPAPKGLWGSGTSGNVPSTTDRKRRWTINERR